MRKYAGLGLGAVLSLIFVAFVVADTIGPNHVYNASAGWNSPIFHDSTVGRTEFDIRYCQSSVTSVKYDLMHHWPFFPSTGTLLWTSGCVNNSTWHWMWWDNVGNADYSVEYTHDNNATVTFWYQISY